MERRPTLSELAVSGVIVLAVVVAGVGFADRPDSPSTWTNETHLDDSVVQQWSAAAVSALGLVGARLQTMTASASAVVEHAPEALLVVELGLLVEHLRLLHRVGHALPDENDDGHAERPSREDPER